MNHNAVCDLQHMPEDMLMDEINVQVIMDKIKMPQFLKHLNFANLHAPASKRAKTEK